MSRSYEDALDSAELIGMSLNLDALKDCLDKIEETLKILKKIIEENVSPMAKELAQIKGVSRFQASVLCNAVEGRTFESKNQLIAFFGLDIRKKESGVWRGREKLSKRGNSF